MPIESIRSILNTILDNVTFIVLAFAIFRISFRYNVARMALMASLLTAPYFFKTLFHSSLGGPFFILFYTVISIISLIILFEIPFLYACLIVCSTQLTIVTIEALLIIMAQGMNIYTSFETRFSETARNTLLFFKFIIVFLISLFLHWKRLGFMFSMYHFAFEKRTIRKRDIYIGFVFLCTILLIQGILIAFKMAGTEASSFYWVFWILGGVTVLGYYINYRMNTYEFDKQSDKKKHKNTLN